MTPNSARDAPSLPERVEIAGREIDPEDDYDYGYEDEGDAPPVPTKKVPTGTVYEAARAGDVDRLTWLVHEEGVDVNARDRWDSVPLYYACLAGARAGGAERAGLERSGGFMTDGGARDVRRLSSIVWLAWRFMGPSEKWRLYSLSGFTTPSSPSPGSPFLVSLCPPTLPPPARGPRAHPPASPGHLEAARVLLEAGAICSEHTFDGDRCHYAALTLRIRRLLKRYEMRPPPLDPLPKAFKDLLDATAAKADALSPSAGAPPGPPCVPVALLDPRDPLAPDIAFHIDGRVVLAHKPVLAARSDYFDRAFASKWRDRSEVFLANPRLTHGALAALLGFVYSDRLDVPVAGLPDLVRACRAAKCGAGLVRAVDRERVHDKLAQHKVPPRRALGLRWRGRAARARGAGEGELVNGEVAAGAGEGRGDADGGAGEGEGTAEGEEEDGRSERGRERAGEEEDEAQRRFILTAASLPEEERLAGGMQRLLARCMVRSDTRAMDTDDGEGAEGYGEPGGECADGGEGEVGGGGLVGGDGAEGEARRKVRFGTVESSGDEGREWARGEDEEWRGEGADGGAGVGVHAFGSASEPDHADCCFSVAGCVFRCHRVVMAARCDYFRVLFVRQAVHAHSPPHSSSAAEGQRGGTAAVLLGDGGAVLPCFHLPDLTPYAFHKILEFMCVLRSPPCSPFLAAFTFSAAIMPTSSTADIPPPILPSPRIALRVVAFATCPLHGSHPPHCCQPGDPIRHYLPLPPSYSQHLLLRVSLMHTPFFTFPLCACSSCWAPTLLNDLCPPCNLPSPVLHPPAPVLWQAMDVIDAAARFLLFPLKRAVADALIPHLHSADMPSLCHWLLAADMYGVWKLREHVLDVMAANFDAFAACPAFRAMLARLPPPSGNDSVRTTAPSLHGEQVPTPVGQAAGGAGGDGVGGVESMNVLDDLREKWLELEGAELEERDASAAEFDKRLETLAALALDWVALAELWMRSYCPPMDAALMHQLAALTVSSLAAPSVNGATGSSSAITASSSEESHGAAVAGQVQLELAALLGGEVPRGEATVGEEEGTERGCESVEKHCLQSLVDIHVSHGRCRCAISVTPELVNRYNTLHGGAIATLTDVVTSAALIAAVGPPGGVSTDLSVAYLDAAKLGEVVDVDASVLRVGKSLAFLQALFHRRSDGVLLAVGRHTKFLVGPQRQSRAPVRSAGGQADPQAHQGGDAGKQGDGSAGSMAVRGEAPLDAGLASQPTLQSRL
ncbi:unnamed protein product [Closterium sp. Naga37s-1]|nr:unnamed protein product [Closterium sp. Naga37s-1]